MLEIKQRKDIKIYCARVTNLQKGSISSVHNTTKEKLNYVADRPVTKMNEDQVCAQLWI